MYRSRCERSSRLMGGHLCPIGGSPEGAPQVHSGPKATKDSRGLAYFAKCPDPTSRIARQDVAVACCTAEFQPSPVER
jgi:hypothetical protein